MSKKQSPAERSRPKVDRPSVDPPPTPKGKPAAIPGSKNPERRCTATSRGSGERCKAAAIKGGNVCVTHGGRAPQVRRSAQQRLLDLVEPAITELARLLTRKDVEDSVKLRAIQMLLDRTGHGPSATVAVQNSQWDVLIAQAVGINVEQLGEVGIDRSLPAVRTTAPGHVVDEDIVDAEVVGEDNG